MGYVIFGRLHIIFSSSATIYGDAAEIPITENCSKGVCTNPYGWTKSMLEQVLMDVQKADNEWNVVIFRYFNPIGALRTHVEQIGLFPNKLTRLNNWCRYQRKRIKVGTMSEEQKALF